MKKTTITTIIFIIFSSFFFISLNKINTIDLLIKKINDNFELKTNDALYVHTDKPYYIAGENLWFKIYLRKATNLLPGKWSKGVNIELISPENEIIDERKIYAYGEFSNGDFKLSSALKEGRYRLRAYSNWMRNFGDSTFFNQEIQIYQINPDSLRIEEPMLSEEATNEQIRNRRQKFDLQFFPESGKFIENISTNIGVKLISQNGYGEAFNAKIYDQEDQLITTIRGNKVGMGSFFINGLSSNSYYAILDRDTLYSNPTKYPLPKIEKKGTTLFVVNNQQINIKIISTDDALSQGGYLLASSHNKILYSWNCPPNHKIIPIKLPYDALQNGVIKLTLLNKDLKPIVERVVFHYLPQNIDISFDKNQYKKREKVEVNLQLKDQNGAPIQGDASVAIIDQNLVDVSQKKNNIISQLSFSNELRGQVENPNWYFNKYNPEKKAALDDLMLTQGYRKINWLETAQDSVDIKFIPEPGISFRGKTSNFWNEEKIQKSEISMTSFEGKSLIHESIITDDQGGFTFTGMVFFDSTDFIFQAKRYNDKKKKTTKNKSVKISLFELEPPMIAPLSMKNEIMPSGNSLAEFEKEILNIEKIDRAFNTKTIILDEIEISDVVEDDPEFNRISKLHSNYRSRFVTDSMSYAQGLTVWQFLQTEFRTSQVLRRSGSLNAGTSIDEEGNEMQADEIPVVLDGFQVDVDFLKSMSMMEVGFIDVLDMVDGSMYLSNATDGVIAIYTSQGGGGSYIVKGIDNIKSPGFYTSREFYQPKYDVQNDEHAKPDHRITLLWEPNVVFDENGHASLSFFTDDKETKYQFEIEGISNTGKAFYEQVNFENQ